MLANGNSNRSRLIGCLPNESLDKLKLTICVKKGRPWSNMNLGEEYSLELVDFFMQTISISRHIIWVN